MAERRILSLAGGVALSVLTTMGSANAMTDATVTASLGGASALSGTLTSDLGLYQTYLQRFVTPDGRVIDNVNGNITHTESQGYGMLLAVAAGDRETFDRIWTFTETNLYVRPDGLASWKWSPEGGKADAETGQVADPNNASDGDLLIAWALAEAAAAGWNPDYAQRADKIIDALSRVLERIEPFGLVPSMFAATALSMFADDEAGLPAVLVYAVLAALGGWLLFIVALELPIAAFWR